MGSNEDGAIREVHILYNPIHTQHNLLDAGTPDDTRAERNAIIFSLVFFFFVFFFCFTLFLFYVFYFSPSNPNANIFLIIFSCFRLAIYFVYLGQNSSFPCKSPPGTDGVLFFLGSDWLFA